MISLVWRGPVISFGTPHLLKLLSVIYTLQKASQPKHEIIWRDSKGNRPLEVMDIRLIGIMLISQIFSSTRAKAGRNFKGWLRWKSSWTFSVPVPSVPISRFFLGCLEANLLSVFWCLFTQTRVPYPENISSIVSPTTLVTFSSDTRRVSTRQRSGTSEHLVLHQVICHLVVLQGPPELKPPRGLAFS